MAEVSYYERVGRYMYRYGRVSPVISLAEVYQGRTRDFLTELRKHNIALPLSASDLLKKVEHYERELGDAIHTERKEARQWELTIAGILDKGEWPGAPDVKPKKRRRRK